MRILNYITAVLCCTVLCCCTKNTTDITVYYADAQLMGLVPVTYSINCSSAQAAARVVADKLITGMDNNRHVMRLIPKEHGCIRVKLKDGLAYVDFSEKSWDKLPTDRDREKLLIYQIVNSFCSLDGIRGVRLSVDGKPRKKPDGHIETRDILLPESDM